MGEATSVAIDGRTVPLEYELSSALAYTLEGSKAYDFELKGLLSGDFQIVPDKTFDLRRLDSADLITVYWMGDAIAHVMISFGFGGTDFVAFSIEARKEKDEGYSSVKGFFRQYELFYVVADERDVIRLRTDYRNPRENVYLYRTRLPPQDAQQIFLEYVGKINDLKQRPEFCNTLTTNCTTNVGTHTRASNPPSHDLLYWTKVQYLFFADCFMLHPHSEKACSIRLLFRTLDSKEEHIEATSRNPLQEGRRCVAREILYRIRCGR